MTEINHIPLTTKLSPITWAFLGWGMVGATARVVFKKEHNWFQIGLIGFVAGGVLGGIHLSNAYKDAKK